MNMVDAGQVASRKSNRSIDPRSRHVTGRRHFFRLFAGETVALIDELQGTPQCRLVDLWELPNAELAALVPQICPGVDIVPQDGRTCARIPGNGDLLALFISDEESEFIFNRFDGLHTIGQIACELGTALAVSEEESLARVRTLFLRLVRMKACIPSNEGPPRNVSLPE